MGKRKNIDKVVFFGASMLLAGTAYAAPQVNVMPGGDTDQTAYTWVGNTLSIWGNVKGGVGAMTYEWDVNHDGTPECSGTVTDARDIVCSHAYGSANINDAVLTVTDSNGDSGSATVRIKVLPAVVKEAQINLAIEKGLKWLYKSQRSDGGIWNSNYANSAGVETAAAVLAFENKNHKPCTADQDGDGDVDAADRAIWENGRIYAETVHKGLDYMLTRVAAFSDYSFAGGASLYDSNHNGFYVADMYRDHATYKSGMYMMALIGAGNNSSGAPQLVATTGPANVIGKTYREIIEDMVDYCDLSQYHNATYGGGWIYNIGEGYGDNSASQWPAIGMDAAQMIWGVPVRQSIKDLNFAWINYSQYFTGYDPNAYYYGALGYRGKDVGIARTASGICQLSMQGKLKNDPRILAAAKYLGTRASVWADYVYGRTSYAMYAIAKGCRIAKVDTNSDGIGDTYSEIELLNGWDWYSTLSTELLAQQYGDGHWYNWYYSGSTLDTAWAVEILTKNVFVLRPVANLTASPNPTPANQPVIFNACTSSHQDPQKLLVSWQLDVDNDGTFDLSGTFPNNCTRTYSGYADLGHDYSAQARLRVVDNVGESAEKTISVGVVSGNVAPVADPGGPYHGAVGEDITFDGSASYDPNEGQGIPGDHIVSWNWDLDGDGVFDDASGETVDWSWPAPYAGSIGLEVCDDAGLCTSTSTTGNFTEIYVIDIWPAGYTLVSRTRVSSTVYEYRWQFSLGNSGNAAARNVLCNIDKVPAQVTIIDGQVVFGDIAGGTTVTSGDTFTLRMNRTYPVANTQVRWKIEYDDVDGRHFTFIDVPLY